MAAFPPLGLTDWVSFAASFVFVLLLIATLFFLLRRLASGKLHARGCKQIDVLETQTMGNRQRIVLIRAKDREILLGMTMQQISTLAVWSPEELAKNALTAKSGDGAASGVSTQPGLMQLLGSLQSRRKQ